MIDTSQYETRVWIDKWDGNNPHHITFKNIKDEVVGEYKYRAKKKKSKLTDLSEVPSN